MKNCHIRKICIGIVALGIVTFMATFSEAKFYWPWEKPQHYRLHSPHAKAKPNLAGHVNRDDAPNCDQINSAIKTLNPDNYERSMRTSSKKQKEYIALCQEKKNP